MAKLLSIIILVFFLVNPGIPEKMENEQSTSSAKIQLALILDTSNSMDGLIDQAKSQIWKIVNEMAISKIDGKNPELELALYAYGNDNFNATKGYIEIQSALSQDLDNISDRLFRLTTKGGSEYCGQVIHTALTDLDWSASEKDFKLIVIAGNEPFDQGPVVPNDAYKLACEKGIAITTIFCGDWKEGIATGWKDAPACVSKKYLNIDQDETIAHIPTPYDDEIIALNSKLNDTYLAYGHEGNKRMELQKQQDINANAYGSANLRERASFKSKAIYNNANGIW
ncbi:MAG: VWA domain-containing protein [Saprospiraceae bacterium]